jgi:hypothetical protein
LEFSQNILIFAQQVKLKSNTMEPQCCEQPTQERKLESVINQIIDLEDAVSGLRNRVYSALERVDGPRDPNPDSGLKGADAGGGTVGTIEYRIREVYQITDDIHSLVSELERII